MFLLASKAQTPMYKKQEADSVFLPEKKANLQQNRDKQKRKMQKRLLAVASIKEQKIKLSKWQRLKIVFCSILNLKNIFLVREIKRKLTWRDRQQKRAAMFR